MRVEIKWNPHDGTFWHVQVDSNGNGQLNISKEEVDELITKLKKARRELRNESKRV
jgi:hypothetical protein